MRRLLRRVHLWLGLALGGLFALLGVTGSLLVFYPEIDRLLHPALQAEGAAPPAGPEWDRALATLRTAFPDKQGPWRIEVTGTPGPIPVRYYDPPERAGHAFRPMMVWLSPDGGAVIRRDYWGEYAVTFVYDLHYRLLLEETGAKVVGWAGLPLLALVASGIWAWWPRGSWGKALRLKLRAHPQRALRDWHKLAGLGGAGLLLILSGTGVMLALPDETGTVLAAGGIAPGPAPHVHPPAPGRALPPSRAVAAAARALPGARLAWIETPPATGGTYRLRMQVPGDPSHRFPKSYVWVDGASARVLAVQDARRGGPGATLLAWLHPLHDGSAAGLPGRLLAVLAGLLPLALFVTGLLRWRLRAKGRGHATATSR